LEKTITVTVLPNKATPYAVADGGDFDSNPNDFAADNIGTSAFSRGNSVQAGKSGTHSGSFAWVIDINSAQYTPNSTAYFTAPTIIVLRQALIQLTYMPNTKLKLPGMVSG